MSVRCQNCFRPMDFCLCPYTCEIDSGVKFVFLTHPKEYRKQRTGTGRLSKISLKDSEILVGVDFSENVRLCSLLRDENYFPILLYPDKNAWNATKDGFAEVIGSKTILAIVIDATWFCSRKILEHSPFLLNLPKMTFSGEYRSIFTFKREPRPECLSTIETCYYLIRELQTAHLVSQETNPEPLMTVFKQMIKDQIRAENERIAGLRPNSHPNDWKYTKMREMPEF